MLRVNGRRNCGCDCGCCWDFVNCGCGCDCECSCDCGCDCNCECGCGEDGVILPSLTLLCKVAVVLSDLGDFDVVLLDCGVGVAFWDDLSFNSCVVGLVIVVDASPAISISFLVPSFLSVPSSLSAPAAPAPPNASPFTVGVVGAEDFPALDATVSVLSSDLVGAEVDVTDKAANPLIPSNPDSPSIAAAALAAASLASTRFAIATILLARRSNVRVISRITWLTFQLSRLPSAMSAYVRSRPRASGSGRRKTCVTL